MSYFGTDGIRGKFGVLPITPEFALKLGFAAGKVLKRHSKKSKPLVVLGKDTRLSGYILESALQAGLNAAGVYVHLLGPLPTPAIAHLTRALHASLGIVISASHNPYFDNGIKFFSSEGKKLPDAIQEEINQELEKELVIEDTANLGKSVRVKDANGRYIEFCKSTFPYHLDLNDLTIVVDCANGAAYNVGPSVFRELGAKVIAIHNEPNGVNINEQCGSTHPESLQQAVVENGADLGIAFDGDADRVILVDKDGISLTIMAFIIKAVAHLLKEERDFASHLADDGKSVLLRNEIHMGIAVATPDGLTVPVLRNPDQKSIKDIAVELGVLGQKARDKKLSPKDLQGANFTISSLGAIGGTAFTPLVNWPQVAILGISPATMQPVWNGQGFDPKLMLPLSLSYDHRVINGADAARFTNKLTKLLKDIRTLLI
jgi:hypothetical protein